MEKKIQDYFHLYLGCEVMEVGNNKGKLYAIGQLGGDGNFRVLVDCSSSQSYWTIINNVKPILRPLSDMTGEEVTHIGVELKAGTWNAEDVKSWANTDLLWTVKHLTPKVFHYLLKQSFDLFGLIESGLAIDATTLEPSKQ